MGFAARLRGRRRCRACLMGRRRGRGRAAGGGIGTDQVPGTVDLVIEETKVVCDGWSAVESTPGTTRTLGCKVRVSRGCEAEIDETYFVDDLSLCGFAPVAHLNHFETPVAVILLSIKMCQYK